MSEQPSPNGSAPRASRRDRRTQSKKRTRRVSWYVISAVAVLIAGVVAAGLLGGRKQANAAKVAPRPVPTTAPPATCPLTGAPAPGGVVPNRPALGIKIGN
ncbi:MAG: hypothetical protein ACYDDZ_13945, partial [Acidimicrobiales bacterium]